MPLGVGEPVCLQAWLAGALAWGQTGTLARLCHTSLRPLSHIFTPDLATLPRYQWVADAFGKSSVYNDLIHLKGYPHLDNKREYTFSERARDVMTCRDLFLLSTQVQSLAKLGLPASALPVPCFVVCDCCRAIVVACASGQSLRDTPPALLPTFSHAPCTPCHAPATLPPPSYAPPTLFRRGDYVSLCICLIDAFCRWRGPVCRGTRWNRSNRCWLPQRTKASQ